MVCLHYSWMVLLISCLVTICSPTNLFQSVNQRLERTLNKLFKSLMIEKDFLRHNETRQSLKKYGRLKTVFNDNYNYFKQIQEICRRDVLKSNNTIDLIVNNKNISHEEIIASVINSYKKKTIVNTNNLDETDINTSVITSKAKDNDVFSDESLRAFIKKIHNLSIDDFVDTNFSSDNTDDLYSELEQNFTSYEEYSVSRRIFMGQKKKIVRYPFFASIHILEKFTCGGSILSNMIVITAASCLQIAHNNRFYRENPRIIHVRVGSSYRNFGGEIIPALEVYFYPTYNPRTLKDNIALIRLYKKIWFKKRKRKVGKIDIDTQAHMMPNNIDGIHILGWGSRNPRNAFRPNILYRFYYTKLDYYPLEECQSVYQASYINERMFCAGFFSKGGGACDKDLGGPAFVDGILMGIISFGSPVCGAPDFPTVFVKVGFYAKWIQEIIAQDDLVPERGIGIQFVYQDQVTETTEALSKTFLPALNQYIKLEDKPFQLFTITPNETEVARQGNQPTDNLIQFLENRERNIQNILYDDQDNTPSVNGQQDDLNRDTMDANQNMRIGVDFENNPQFTDTPEFPTTEEPRVISNLEKYNIDKNIEKNNKNELQKQMVTLEPIVIQEEQTNDKVNSETSTFPEEMPDYLGDLTTHNAQTTYLQNNKPKDAEQNHGEKVNIEFYQNPKHDIPYLRYTKRNINRYVSRRERLTKRYRDFNDYGTSKHYKVAGGHYALHNFKSNPYLDN